MDINELHVLLIEGKVAGRGAGTSRRRLPFGGELCWVCNFRDDLLNRSVRVRHGLLLMAEHVLCEVGVGDFHELIYFDDFLETVGIVRLGGFPFSPGVLVVIWIMANDHRGLRVVVLYKMCLAGFRLIFGTLSLNWFGNDPAGAADDPSLLPGQGSCTVMALVD